MEQTIEEKMKRTSEIWGVDMLITLSVSEDDMTFVACHAQPSSPEVGEEDDVVFSDPAIEKLRKRGKLKTLDYFG